MSYQQLLALGGNGLTEADLMDFSEQKRRIYELMKDGRWHTRREIEEAGKCAEAIRRMRDLRQFYPIEKRRATDNRIYEYRMVI